MAYIGGTERIISNKMNYLAEKGYEITLITTEQGKHPLSFELDKKINIYDLNTRFFTLQKYGIAKRVFENFKLRKRFKKSLDSIVKENAPDIICCTTYSTNVLDIISTISKKYKAKSIIESHVSMYSLLNFYDNSRKNIMFYIKIFFTKMNLRNIKKYDILVVLTKGDAIAWSKYKKAIIIPNFVNSTNEPIPFKRKTQKRIISVGRLEFQKGYDLLFQAIPHLLYDRGWRLDIFGNGPDKEKLCLLIDELGLNEIIKINKPSHHIYNEYKNSDFLILSSRYEGFGLVLTEAMSNGIPCVSFDCEYGPSEIINDGKNGLLAKNGNIIDLANKIDWMISHEKERLEMGRQAFEDAKCFNVDKIMNRWIKLFCNICK
jgi:glycosyltransferase involved in cell wall biosynthesis